MSTHEHRTPAGSPPAGSAHPCRCCQDIGWTLADQPVPCGHHPERDTLNFAGEPMTACPHHADDQDDDAEPDHRATPDGAQQIVDRLIASGIHDHLYDELGIHHGQLRQLIALDHLERNHRHA